MKRSVVRIGLPLLFLAGPLSVEGQAFADFCPEGDEETQAAVVGYVVDPDAETILPGATVAASWVGDGMRQRAEAQSGLDGLYVICGLPREAVLTLRATMGALRGEAAEYMTAVSLAQQDLNLSLTAPQEDEDDVRAEIGNLSGGSAAVLNSEVIRAEDLVNFPEMSVYDLLRRHNKLRFDRRSGGEIILLATTRSMSGANMTGVQLRVDERRELGGVDALKEMSIDQVRRIEILDRGQASNRYGGDGWSGAISITTR